MKNKKSNILTYLIVLFFLVGCADNKLEKTNAKLVEDLEVKAKELQQKELQLQAQTSEIHRLNVPPPDLLRKMGGLPEASNAKYEIRIKNDAEDERLAVTSDLAWAKKYVERYMEYHSDLVVYELKTGDVLYRWENQPLPQITLDK
jgi:hypothetical protein